MTTDVEALEINETGSDLARCRVETTDATGTERVYEVSLSTTMVRGGHVMAGRRVVPEPENERFPDGPSDAAWDAAAEHFREQGYEVWR